MDSIEIPLSDGAAEAYVARPTGDSRDHPGVLFFMDAIGLRPRIAEMAQRIADWGYVVLAPNVFYREGSADELAPKTDLTEAGAREEFFKQAMPRVAGAHLRQGRARHPGVPRGAAWSAGRRDGPVGATGYCMGARLAVRAANLDPEVVAVGGFHGGGLVTDAEDSPHRGLSTATGRVRVRARRPRPVDAVRRRSRAGGDPADAGLTASNEVYEGAAHGYSMADTSVYDEAATERHFDELRALLARTL